MSDTPSTQPKFSLPRLARLSSFQIGSAMGDILVTSIWNRVMISNFGIPATPVSFLIALRYLLSPLSLWAGHLSDVRPFFGLRRTPYIWAGRLLMILSLPLLGLSLAQLQVDQGDVLGWSYATASSLLYGVGTLISGSPFLALVRENHPNVYQEITSDVPPSDKVIRGVVAAVRTNPQGKQDLVMLTVGEDEGIREGMEFIIYRGNNYIVKVRAERVMGDMVAGRVIPDTWNARGDEIQQGDLAQNRLF